MSRLLDDDDLIERRERELTLSTGAILGIFFGLVLICGAFFAFGYNMGKKSTVGAPLPADSEDSTPSANFSSFKPSAGSPAGTPAASAPVPANASTPVSAPPPPSHTTTPAPSADEPPAPAPARTPTAAAPVAAVPAASAANVIGTFFVQVAAVSHQEDASLLVDALHGKGYTVAARTEPQDHLIHIQVGPFGNHRDADAMRQRLLADGYNAIVK